MKKKTNMITFVELGFSYQKTVNKPINKLNICSFVIVKSGTENHKEENMHAEQLGH